MPKRRVLPPPTIHADPKTLVSGCPACRTGLGSAYRISHPLGGLLSSEPSRPCARPPLPKQRRTHHADDTLGVLGALQSFSPNRSRNASRRPQPSCR